MKNQFLIYLKVKRFLLLFFTKYVTDEDRKSTNLRTNGTKTAAGMG
jgi:hypothetical protein